MSCNYADGLSPYQNKGQLGLDEKFDKQSALTSKCETLAKWINKSKHVVIHTGAGISTSAGIPDFRGPKGVWTLEAKGKKPDLSMDFNDTVPTATHMAITRMVEANKIKYVVSQNIDGLHLRSGLSRKYLSELHGNMFTEQCNACNRQFVRNKAVPTVGQKSLQKPCPTIKPNGRACRGRLHDTILDWEHNLPENDLAMADFHSCLADLSITLGTTMQIVPSGSLPLYTKKAGGKLVIINLQPTKHDAKADLLIHGYVDEVITKVMKLLSLKIPKYSPKNDPTKLSLSFDKYFEWTISDKATQQMRELYEAKCGTKEAKKRLENIDDDDVPLLMRVKKRKSDEPQSSRIKEEPPEIQIEEEIRPKRGRRPKVQSDSPPIPPTKLTIKKNVTPNKTKYEIVPTRPSRSEKKASKRSYEIVKEEEPATLPDLEMICESDDDGPYVVKTTNFKRYLYDDTMFKREEKVDPDAEAVPSTSMDGESPLTVKEEDSEVKSNEAESGGKEPGKEDSGGACLKEKPSEKSVEEATSGSKISEASASRDLDAVDGTKQDGGPNQGEAATCEAAPRVEPVVQEATEAQSGATPAEGGSNAEANEASGAISNDEPAAVADIPVAEEEPVPVPECAGEPAVPEAAGPGPAPSSPQAGEIPQIDKALGEINKPSPCEDIEANQSTKNGSTGDQNSRPTETLQPEAVSALEGEPSKMETAEVPRNDSPDKESSEKISELVKLPSSTPSSEGISAPVDAESTEEISVPANPPTVMESSEDISAPVNTSTESSDDISEPVNPPSIVGLSGDISAPLNESCSIAGSEGIPAQASTTSKTAASIENLGNEDLPPINENLLYENSDMDPYGNY